jgi:hypothetical protein
MIAMPTLTVAIKPCVSRPRKGETVTVGETTLTRMGIARLSISDLPEPERMAISRTVPSRVCYSEVVVVVHNA